MYESLTELLLLFTGGVVGALLMDIAEGCMAKMGVRSGVSIGLVGRWAIALTQGIFSHRDIRRTHPYQNEVVAGWAFHLVIGGGAVALPFALFWLGEELPQQPHPYLLYGLATSALPWFILLPSFGWGWWGSRGPKGSSALVASPLSHIPYGIGLWVVVNLNG